MTVFGATGFLGRYVVSRLGREAARDWMWGLSLIECSSERMYRRSPISGRYGKTAPESDGRSGKDCFHGLIYAS